VRRGRRAKRRRARSSDQSAVTNTPSSPLASISDKVVEPIVDVATGAWTVFFSRMLPIVRTFISLPAGVAKMPFWRFTTYTLLGCVPWVLALALIGRSVGENWEDWKHKLGYFDYVIVVAILAGIVYWIVKRRRGGPGPDEGGSRVPVEVSGPSGV
jgi:hypothetical protein